MNNNTDGAKAKVLNVPNMLTISRMFMIPVFIAFFYVHFTGHYFVALAVFIIASLTDLLDGMIARISVNFSTRLQTRFSCFRHSPCF